MKILERLVVGKYGDPIVAKNGYEDPDVRCEDQIVVTGDFLAVLDGATDLSGSRYGDVTAGRFAADVVAQGLCGLPADSEAVAAINSLAQQLDDAILAERGGVAPAGRPAVQLACYSIARQEVWRIGDAHYAIDGSISLGDKEIDRVTGAFHHCWTDGLVRAGVSIDDIRREDPAFFACAPLFALESHWANQLGSPYTFGVLNGTPVPDSLIDVVDASGAQVITLASDGYFNIDGDLTAAETNLQDILTTDPLLLSQATNRAWRSGFRSYDDRAWLRFTRE